VFIERKIAGRMFGEQLRHFLALDGWTELRNQVYSSYIISISYLGPAPGSYLNTFENVHLKIYIPV